MSREDMFTVDFIVQPVVDPVFSAATDRHFLRAVPRRSRTCNGILRVYGFSGDVLLLGRYHRAPGAGDGTRVRVCRRHSGGRALPFGDGFVGVSLVLPHRSAWFSEDPFHLAPHQVMNRYVRGVLEACRGAGLSVFYPGRDTITVDRRILAAVSFETNEQGALLFEAFIANGRDFAVLSHFLDQADRERVVNASPVDPAATTSLERELGAHLTLGEVAEMVRRGYAEHFGLRLEPHELSPLELQAIEAIAARECQPESWLWRRAPGPELDRHARMWVQLGVLEAHFALEQGQFLREVVLAGDFIANSSAIETLERELRLCAVDRRAIDAVVRATFAHPENFILGIGPLRTIADLIVRGAAS